ncbi:hypothetical protein P9VFCI_200 [Rhizobium phage P9VFCI]|uniref:Uncharacterized protein n=1 Tax=Rhizobium phage P9VFCI TaxID=2763531 RepID=A0A7G7WXT1_9CAUD|nr:hypothetical protein PP937_gp200 [Rhizobium phage P9VFCI]QNH72025.1 hypothetical protein P9VFCI_200 [Rhizobium phage P9VFCI]
MNKILKWFRPAAYGDVWDAMSDVERKTALISDIFVAGIGALIVIAFGMWVG